MKGKRVAVVVPQPAHLPAAAGMLLRWRPHVLILFRAAGREDTICSALAERGLCDRLTHLGVSEDESLARALVGDFAFHAAIADRIFDWMCEVRPDAVLGGAFEGGNFHHDLARLLTDDAVQRWRSLGRRIDNYEFPLSSRIDPAGASVRLGEVGSSSVHELKLNARELVDKREIAARVAPADRLPNPGLEIYREVPPDRDYTEPPGLALSYGQRIRGGEAVTFRGHFVPLVRALGLGPAARTAAA